MYYFRSMSYCKYRLCCTLGTEEGEVADITFVDFLNFERNLKQTVATSLIEVWACCEAHTMGVEQQWAQIHAIRAHCVSLPFLTTEVIIIVSFPCRLSWGRAGFRNFIRGGGGVMPWPPTRVANYTLALALQLTTHTTAKIKSLTKAQNISSMHCKIIWIQPYGGPSWGACMWQS